MQSTSEDKRLNVYFFFLFLLKKNYWYTRLNVDLFFYFFSGQPNNEYIRLMFTHCFFFFFEPNTVYIKLSVNKMKIMSKKMF